MGLIFVIPSWSSGPHLPTASLTLQQAAGRRNTAVPSRKRYVPARTSWTACGGHPAEVPKTRAAVDRVDLGRVTVVHRDNARAIRGDRQRPPLERLDRRSLGRETPWRATVDVLNVALRALADLLTEPDDVRRIQPAGIVEHDLP